MPRSHSVSPSSGTEKKSRRGKKVTKKRTTKPRKPTHWMTLVMALSKAQGGGCQGLTNAMKSGKSLLQEFKSEFPEIPSQTTADAWAVEKMKSD